MRWKGINKEKVQQTESTKQEGGNMLVFKMNISGLTLTIKRQRCLGWGGERKTVIYKVRLPQTENKRTENVIPEKCNLEKELKS